MMDGAVRPSSALYGPPAWEVGGTGGGVGG